MNSNCCNCTPIKTVFISRITTTSTGVILIPSTTISASDLRNLDKYKLIIACRLKATSNLPVYIQTVIGNIPLLCRYAGNNIFPDQLKTRRCYTVVYGNNNVFSSLGQFVLQNCVCPTNGIGTTGSTNTPITASTTVEENTKSKKVNE